ncbi:MULTISPECIES: acyl-CoA dehydrogenase family protein [unclassified Mycobacterium]|uniref:acyl-CoA dehydrogenase family protein n=1 Tax=unclassified Mycobacterium TaxID=2642494 RepID=UPI0029C96244|nr:MULTISPECIES: acyl-CoA dehydrogenase family protein [unclassified Mycobacterium]
MSRPATGAAVLGQTADEFTAEAQAFLQANAPRRPAEKQRQWGRGSDAVIIFQREPLGKASEQLRAARQWVQTRFDHGFGWITGPAEFGGRELDSSFQLLYNEMEAQYVVPDFANDLGMVGINLVVPTIYAHGTDEQREAYLRPILRGELIGCQLFSEPGAGSDLAALQTRAVRDGDDWIVNGQKVWTSLAHCSELGELLCRTDPAAAKHNGITAFLLDMNTPGVDVRPLRQMTGGAEFNEVFFNDVRIPDAHRLGPVNGGWKVGLTTLLTERSAVGSDDVIAAEGALNVQWLIAMLDALDLLQDPHARRGLAELYVKRASTERLREQLNRAARDGRTPGPEASALKLLNTRNVNDAVQYVSEVLGPKLIADNGQWGTYAWSELLLSVPALRLVGGTDEVMRNIIGERVLGLPKEPSVAEARR